jgi:uncharacterized protein (TIGR02231 family)
MKDITAESSIKEVVLYTDRAFTTRSADLNVSKGVVDVVFTPLPASLNPQSIRASGKGTADVKILGCEFESIYTGEASDEEILSLEKELEKLRDQYRILQDKKALLDEKKSRLSELNSFTVKQLSKSLGRGEMKTDDSDNLLEFLFNKDEKLMDTIYKIDIEMRELEKEILKKENEYNKLKHERMTEYGEIRVSLEVLKAGDFNIFVDYTIGGCGWYPGYDIMYSEKDNSVHLTYYGIVFQNTGEHWKDVELYLSTYKPHIGATPAELNPWYLDFYHPVTSAPPSAGFRMKKMEDTRMPEGESAYTEADAEEVFDEVKEAEVSQAEVEYSGVATVFHLPGKADIPPDGKEHKESIGRFPMEGEVDYLIQPALEEMAYMRVKVENNTEVFLLPGSVNIIRDGNYIGTGYIAQIAPGEEFELFLGIDERIKVKRRVDRKDKDEAGIISKSNHIVQDINIELESMIDDEVKVEVVEAVPVSRNTDIKVKVKDKRPKEKEIDKENLLKWYETVEPEGKVEFNLSYEIEYPSDKTITGI